MRRTGLSLALKTIDQRPALFGRERISASHQRRVLVAGSGQRKLFRIADPPLRLTWTGHKEHRVPIAGLMHFFRHLNLVTGVNLTADSALAQQLQAICEQTE